MVQTPIKALTAEGMAQINQEPIQLSLVQSLTGASLVNQLGRPPRSATDGVESPDSLVEEPFTAPTAVPTEGFSDAPLETQPIVPDAPESNPPSE